MQSAADHSVPKISWGQNITHANQPWRAIGRQKFCFLGTFQKCQGHTSYGSANKFFTLLRELSFLMLGTGVEEFLEGWKNFWRGIKFFWPRDIGLPNIFAIS